MSKQLINEYFWVMSVFDLDDLYKWIGSSVLHWWIALWWWFRDRTWRDLIWVTRVLLLARLCSPIFRSSRRIRITTSTTRIRNRWLRSRIAWTISSIRIGTSVNLWVTFTRQLSSSGHSFVSLQWFWQWSSACGISWSSTGIQCIRIGWIRFKHRIIGTWLHANC